MSKGIAPLIGTLLIILVIVSITITVFYWSQNVSETFKEVSEKQTESKIKKTNTAFSIVNIAGTEIGIKNNGKVSIDVNDINFYVNRIKRNPVSISPPVSTIDPGDTVIFDLDVDLTSKEVKVAGPYGISETVGEYHVPLIWLNGFNYRMKILINNTDNPNSLADYQVKINLNWDPDMQPDFSDIRFTETTDTTTLSYWIEDFTPSTSATVWVKIPSIPASSTKDIYVYFGNQTPVTSGSDGDGTFQYFDHWTSDNTGDWHHWDKNNHHYWYYDANTYDTYREFQMFSKLINWNADNWDHTVIGWVNETDNQFYSKDHVTIYWEHRKSNGADDSHVWVKLHIFKRDTSYTTTLKSFNVPHQTDIIRTTLKYYSDKVEYEMYDITTDTLLASDSITDFSQIPDPTDVSYFFFQAFDFFGGIFKWKSPTELDWGNKNSNGGMEWNTDYWFIKEYTSPEPTTKPDYSSKESQ